MFFQQSTILLNIHEQNETLFYQQLKQYEDELIELNEQFWRIIINEVNVDNSRQINTTSTAISLDQMHRSDQILMQLQRYYELTGKIIQLINVTIYCVNESRYGKMLWLYNEKIERFN